MEKGLPEPALTFTIPSIHDGTVLDCRIYHPASLAASPRAPPWTKHAAVLAHPYAPLGGSYDDPVLEVIAATLLRCGHLVATFNFRYGSFDDITPPRQAANKTRGAGHSAGKNSFSAKPEQEDYMSVVGFVVYYIHTLDPFKACKPYILDDESPSPDTPPTLILGGYSYGAMITMHIPPLTNILELFATPQSHSHTAQIRLRAETLAEQQNTVLSDARAALLQHRNPSSPTKRSIRIGGEEGSQSPRHQSPRHSGDSFSFSGDHEDRFRHGVHELLHKRKALRHGLHLHKDKHDKHDHIPEDDNADGKLHAIVGMVVPKVAYLMVSPLQGIVPHLLALNLARSMFTRSRHPEAQAAEDKLVENPTLAIFGDTDVFVGVAKLRAWVERLGGQESSKFTALEVATAGHFWVEQGVLVKAAEAIKEFSTVVLSM